MIMIKIDQSFLRRFLSQHSMWFSGEVLIKIKNLITIYAEELNFQTANRELKNGLSAENFISCPCIAS